MLFNSYEFIFIFLPITIIVYFYLNSIKLTEASKGFLVFSSLFFYSWWNVIYLPIILSSMLFNYLLGNILSEKKNRKKISKKIILYFGIFCNIMLLGYFKYIDFFIENINFMLSSNFDSFNLLLPLAISFFTFQQIAYLVDSYNKETKEYDFLNYSLFVTFFPQLIAGPIVHHKEMMPQFANLKNKIKNYRNISIGFFIFSLGLFKKTVIADYFSITATNGFDNATILSFFEAWATSLSYTFQLYFDFSGYTDMAIGIALIFNIKLPINFNSPYKALDIQDFWRRWHITLSRFLRDYIYIPLGGNKKNNFNTYTNLMITFIIGGLWHGAGWTFLFWGFLHGLALSIHRFWKQIGIKLPIIIAWFITFNFVNISWVFFRAKEWSDAIKVLSSMFTFSNISMPLSLKDKLQFLEEYGIKFNGLTNNIQGDFSIFIWLFIALLIVVFMNNANKLAMLYIEKKYSFFIVALIFFIAILKLSGHSEFLYFRF